jgi:hypothetical protein
MAKVPLQNESAWRHMKTVDEASNTVSKWPGWKRERQLFSSEPNGEESGLVEKRNQDCKSAEE